ncbi:MAG: CBS domain-containing protein [Proteobacteria bacterium]|nr:CBS domain-containing protein [Pseudomonadota bacterium]MBU1717063.1 CBS domain-containing protein [Pseudomonadota bacterium]
MLTAKDIMTKEVISVTPDMPVDKLAVILWENRISGAPVVNADGKLIAVVTESDLVDQTKKVHIPTVLNFLDSVIYLENPDKIDKEIMKMTGTTVKDICSDKLVTVNEDTQLDEIATIMSDKKLHTLPVVRDGKLVGVVGKSDIILTLIKK